jgi:hypothetical protein
MFGVRPSIKSFEFSIPSHFLLTSHFFATIPSLESFSHHSWKYQSEKARLRFNACRLGSSHYDMKSCGPVHIKNFCVKEKEQKKVKLRKEESGRFSWGRRTGRGRVACTCSRRARRWLRLCSRGRRGRPRRL